MWPSTDAWTPICTRRRTLRQCMNPSLVEYMSGGNVICLILCQDEGHLQNILIKTMSELSFLLVRKLFLQSKTFFFIFPSKAVEIFSTHALMDPQAALTLKYSQHDNNQDQLSYKVNKIWTRKCWS